MKKLMVAAGLCSVMFSACDKDDDNEVNGADQTYVMMASLSNNAEIMAGQVAATKGNSAMVKAYGLNMVNEHTPAQADLKNRAAAVGLSAPDTVDAEHKAAMVYLNGLSGYSFDTAYMNRQIKDHANTP